VSLPLPARPKLDRTAIVEAALALLDEAGLDALSTRTLAAALRVKGPSLYWHFKGMAELRDAMADAVLATALPDPEAPGDWRTWLADGARGVRSAALSRRDGARLLAGARPTEARRRSRFPANIARLQAAGFEPEHARGAFMVLTRYALGYALAEQAADGRTPRSEATFEFGLQALVDGLNARRRV
jgi:TetR/AcrR family transcriptional regulator, tetracycline repressor protein